MLNNRNPPYNDPAKAAAAAEARKAKEAVDAAAKEAEKIAKADFEDVFSAEWAYRFQLAGAFAAGKVVRAILMERQEARPSNRVFKDGSRPEPRDLFLARPMNRGPRNEFFALCVHHALKYEFGYRYVNPIYLADVIERVTEKQFSP
jgi:hypothetical protein